MAGAARRGPRGKRAAIPILVVDADEEMRAALGATLARAGYAVDAAGTAAAALHQALSTEYRMVILDPQLPDADGQLLLSRLLAVRPRQVVMVLSAASDAITKVDCLERGARDYLTKPFSPQELLTRMRLRLEPFTPGWNGHSPPANGTPGRARRPGGDPRRPGSAGACRLRLNVGRLTADAGRGPVRLTRTEFQLLVLLAEHAGQPIPSQRLLTEVWGYDGRARSNVVGVCVRRLRSKLGSATIETIRGEGYRLVTETGRARPPEPGNQVRRPAGLPARKRMRPPVTGSVRLRRSG